MKSSAKNIKMASFDSLFDINGTGNTKEAGDGNVREVPLVELFPFKGHPFKVLDDAAMTEMAESIKEYGVLVPGIARPRDGGGYELVSGHRRKRASELAGKTTMRVIVKELDDDEATLYMVDSNLQRENILPSEKAWAYRMKLDAMRRKAGRPARDNPRQLGENYSVEQLSGKSEDSARNIHRFIRLTELEPALLQMVDDRKLPFNTAVELSYLEMDGQRELLDCMGELLLVPTLEQAGRLKKYGQMGKLNREMMRAVLTEERLAPVQVTLKRERLTKYFPADYTQQQMEEVILSLLEVWKTQHV